MGHDVFISHSSKDKAMADAICAGLEARGIRCWIAPRDVQPGEEWTKAIVDAISGCKTFILVFSDNSNKSTQAIKEVDCAVNHEKTIIPFRIEDIRPSGSMEYYLASLHWMDAITLPLEKHIDELAEYIGRIIKAPISKPIETKIPAKPHGKANWFWLTGMGILAVGIVAAALILGDKIPFTSKTGFETPLSNFTSDLTPTTTNTFEPPTPSLTATIEVTSTPEIVKAKMLREKNCYETTREDSQNVYLAKEGEIVTVLGTYGFTSTTNKGWINIGITESSWISDCWIYTSYIEMNGNLDALPQFTPRPGAYLVPEAYMYVFKPDGSKWVHHIRADESILFNLVEEYCSAQIALGYRCESGLTGRTNWQYEKVYEEDV
jgi:hypothetical protein